MAWGKRRDDVSKRLPKRGEAKIEKSFQWRGKGDGKTSQTMEWMELEANV
jgi:hypothetical protein